MSTVKELSAATYKALLAELCPCCKAGLPIEVKALGQYIHIVPGWFEKHPGGASGFVCDATEVRKIRDKEQKK